MKKVIVLIAACLLTACSSKPETKVTYSNDTRDAIIEDVLNSKPLDKDKTNEIFNSDDSIEVYYEEKDNELTLHVVNNTDYYYSGAIDFEVCESKLAVTALPSGATAASVMDCPNFVKDSEFVFDGNLYERKKEKQLSFDFEVYYYEEDETVFDYVLDLEKISDEHLEIMAQYLYEECVLADYKQELNAYIYTKKGYDSDADDLGFSGYLWINQKDNQAKILDTEGEIIKEIEYKK